MDVQTKMVSLGGKCRQRKVDWAQVYRPTAGDPSSPVSSGNMGAAAGILPEDVCSSQCVAAWERCQQDTLELNDSGTDICQGIEELAAGLAQLVHRMDRRLLVQLADMAVQLHGEMVTHMCTVQGLSGFADNEFKTREEVGTLELEDQSEWDIAGVNDAAVAVVTSACAGAILKTAQQEGHHQLGVTTSFKRRVRKKRIKERMLGFG